MKNYTKHLNFLLPCMGLIFLMAFHLLTGCSINEPKTVSRSGFYFDTIIQITLYGTEDEAYISECFSMAADYENKFSNTISDSEISRINANAGKRAVSVSDDTLELIQLGIQYGVLSDGKFDITVGKLSELWNISEISNTLTDHSHEVDKSFLPDSRKITALLPHIDYSKIEITGNEVFLPDAESKIDLGGIAKGYIADKMKDYLNQAGVTSGIINLGGNVLTIGEKENGKPYTVGIQKPFDETGSAIAAVKVKDKSVVTSGIYERYYRIDGKIYHHLLDVKTGYPVANNLSSVTIISDSSADGDALSTTCFALGAEAGIDFIESLPDTEAVFLLKDHSILTTSGIGTVIPFSEVS